MQKSAGEILKDISAIIETYGPDTKVAVYDTAADDGGYTDDWMYIPTRKKDGTIAYLQVAHAESIVVEKDGTPIPMLEAGIIDLTG